MVQNVYVGKNSVTVIVGHRRYWRSYRSHASAMAAGRRAAKWANKLSGAALRARAEKWYKAPGVTFRVRAK